MVQSIDNALITEFSDMVHHAAQQSSARLRNYVEVKKGSADKWAYEGLGKVEAREVFGRVNNADFDDIDHLRRKVSRRRFVVNLPIDASDVRGSLINPEANYVQAVVKAMARQQDRVIYEAAFADVQTGADFENTVTASADGVISVDATAGLTYPKLLEIRQNFFDEDVGIDMDEKLFMTIGGREQTNLMNETELTSGDFTSQFVVDNGEITRGAGFDFVPFPSNVTQPVIKTNAAGTERELIAASTRGVCMYVSKEMTVKVQERNDLIDTSQVQIIGEMGAVRTEGVLVQKVRVTA